MVFPHSNRTLTKTRLWWEILKKPKKQKQKTNQHIPALVLLPWWPDWPCTGGQWPTWFYLVETLTQNSTISPPNSLGSHWQVDTTPSPCFKSPRAWLVHIWQSQTLLPVPFSLEHRQAAVWRKMQHKLSSETMVTQLLGATTKILTCKSS